MCFYWLEGRNWTKLVIFRNMSFSDECKDILGERLTAHSRLLYVLPRFFFFLLTCFSDCGGGFFPAAGILCVLCARWGIGLDWTGLEWRSRYHFSFGSLFLQVYKGCGCFLFSFPFYSGSNFVDDIPAVARWMWVSERVRMLRMLVLVDLYFYLTHPSSAS